MECEQCGEDFTPCQAYESVEQYYGSWEGNKFVATGSKSTDVYEVTEEFLMCRNGHLSDNEYEVEYY